MVSLLGVLGAILVIGPALGWSVIPKEGPQVAWSEEPQVLHFKVHFFEIQNPAEVHSGAAYPIVKEKGPFVYRETKTKQNIVFSDDNSTASFDVYRTYEFDEEASNGLKDTDEIYILNPVLNFILQMAEMDELTKYLLTIVDALIAKVFNNATDFFLKTTPREVLFQGIEFCISPTGLAPLFCNQVRDTPSDNIVQTENGLSFALFRHKANVPDHFVINTGLTDISTTHIIQQFNGDDQLRVWLNDKDENGAVAQSTCNRLQAAFGYVFPPSPNTNYPLSSFETDVCRVIDVHYEGETQYKGLNALLYRTGKDLVNEVGPEFGNECFCVDATQGVDQTQANGCLYPGAIDLYPCLNGPVIMTKPHFLGANEIYSSRIGGLEPDSEKHDTTIILEPSTGRVLQTLKRIQLNSFLRPIYKIRLSNYYLPVLMPFLWIDEGFEL